MKITVLYIFKLCLNSYSAFFKVTQEIKRKVVPAEGMPIETCLPIVIATC